MTPLEILIAARALISDPARWTTRSYARTKGGWPVRRPTSRDAYAWCAVGAMRCVAGGSKPAAKAERLLRRALRGKPARDDRYGLWAFNDAPGRRHEHVLRLFDRAIAKLRGAQ